MIWYMQKIIVVLILGLLVLFTENWFCHYAVQVGTKTWRRHPNQFRPRHPEIKPIDVHDAFGLYDEPDKSNVLKWWHQSKYKANTKTEFSNTKIKFSNTKIKLSNTGTDLRSSSQKKKSSKETSSGRRKKLQISRHLKREVSYTIWLYTCTKICYKTSIVFFLTNDPIVTFISLLKST